VSRVKVGFFSFVEVTDPAEHEAYNRWHQLDHLPEQYQIDGIAHGERWVRTPACRAAELVRPGIGDPLHYVTLYLVGEPVGPTLGQFAELGRRLAGLGRFHQHRRSHLFGAFQLLEAHVAPRVLVSAEAVPWRPGTGIYVIVEEPTDEARLAGWVRTLHQDHLPRLMAVPGVVGAWSFAASPLYTNPGWVMGAERITVCWLDDDPLRVAAALAPLLAQRWAGAPVRPLLAGPWEPVVAGRWSWFDDDGPPASGPP